LEIALARIFNGEKSKAIDEIGARVWKKSFISCVCDSYSSRPDFFMAEIALVEWLDITALPDVLLARHFS